MSDFPTQKVSKGAVKSSAMRLNNRPTEVKRETRKVMSPLPGVEMLKFSAIDLDIIIALDQFV